MTASIPQLSALQDLIQQFIELYPNRGGSLVKHESGNWREVSRFYDLPDDEIVRAISSQQTLVRATNWDTRTKFTVLNINAESKHHNQLSLWQLQNSLAQKGVHKTRAYQSSESTGWHIYIFWSDWVGSTRSAAVISAILMAAGFEIAPGTLEVFPSAKALRLPLQGGFSWLNESGRVIMRRSEISLEGALALFLDEGVKFANEASWLDSDHANEVSRLFQEQQALPPVLTRVRHLELVAEETFRSESEQEEILAPQLVTQEMTEETAGLQIASEENFAPDSVQLETGDLAIQPEENFSSDLVALVETVDSAIQLEENFAPDLVALVETVDSAIHTEVFAPDLVAPVTAWPAIHLKENFAPEFAEEEASQSSSLLKEVVPEEFDAEDTLSPELVGTQTLPLKFTTGASSPQECGVEETWPLDFAAQAAVVACFAAEKSCSHQLSNNDVLEPDVAGEQTLALQSNDEETFDLEFISGEPLSAEFIAQRIWTPQLAAEAAWPLELPQDEVTAPESTGEEAWSTDLVAEREPAQATKESWIPAFPVNEGDTEYDDYPPVVEQVMQIRPAGASPVSQQLSLPFQDTPNEQPDQDVTQHAPTLPIASTSAKDRLEIDSIDFTPEKVVSLPQRTTGIVRELVEEEIPEIAFDAEPKSEGQSKLKSETNSWAGTAKETKSSDPDTILHSKQRLNNAVNSGPADIQRRKRAPRNTTTERPSPDFPPTP